MAEDQDLSRTDFHEIQKTKYLERRIMGGEQEYGILVRREGKDFTEDGWKTPLRQFLENGSRLYKDVGHPEYASPEVDDPLKAVLYDRAGELITPRRIFYLQKGKLPSLNNSKIARENKRIYKHNVDSIGNLYSAHESYCMDSGGFQENSFVKTMEHLADRVIPFLATRPILVGNGHINDEGNYELTQRASGIKHCMSLETMNNRGILNLKYEPLADHKKYSRLHLIVGDSNMSDPSIFLKFGTTSLVLDLYEDGYLDPFRLRAPVKSLKAISKDINFSNSYRMVRSPPKSAVQIQRHYLNFAQKHYASSDSMTDEILTRWENSLNYMLEDSEKLDRQIDWKIKKKFLEKCMKTHGGTLNDERTRAINLQYHDVDRKRGFFQLLERERAVEKFFSESQIEYASKNPPKNTRARIRGNVIKLQNESKRRKELNVDWSHIAVGKIKFKIDDPYDDYQDLDKRISKLLR